MKIIHFFCNPFKLFYKCKIHCSNELDSNNICISNSILSKDLDSIKENESFFIN